MTETTGVTISNFIAGALALGVALLIIPTIVKGSIGASTSAVNQKDIEQLYRKISGLCGSDTGTTVEGEMSLGSQYKIEIQNPNGQKYVAKKNGKVLDGYPKEFPDNCNHDGGKKTLEGTRPYKIKIINDDDNDANEFAFVG